MKPSIMPILEKIKQSFRRKKRLDTRGLVGVEVSSSGIAVARVHWQGATPKIEYCHFEPVTQPAVQAEWLKKTVVEKQWRHFPCNLVMHPSQYRLSLVERPDVPEQELKDALRWRIRDLVEFPIEEAVVDGFTLPADAYRGRMNMCYAVAIRAQQVKDVAQLIQQGLLDLQYIDITQLALRNLLTAVEPQRLSAILRLRDSGGLITLCEQGNIYFTRDISIGLEKMVDGALDINEQATVIDGLVNEIKRSIDYCESQLGKSGMQKLWLLPTKRPVTGLLETLQASLDVDVEILNLNQWTESPAEEMDDITQARCASAIGAAMRRDHWIMEQAEVA